MARDETHIIGVPREPQSPYPVRPPTRTNRLFQAFLGRRRLWRPLGRGFELPHVPPPVFSPIALESYAGDAVLEQVADGDITLDNIGGHSRVTLESRHGSITITHNVGPWAHANLKAAKAVTICEGIEQHSVVQIVAGGDVTIGQAINNNGRGMIIASPDKIDIGCELDNYSQAERTVGTTVHVGQDIDQHSTARITAQGDVTISGSINQQVTADIVSLNGAITIGQTVKSARGLFTAAETVHIGDKICQRAQVTILARGDVTVGQKIEQNSVAKITSLAGCINIGQGLCGGATATLIARNGSIRIGDSVDQGSAVNWNANDFDCPRQAGTISHL
jgi:hypothetical protein